MATTIKNVYDENGVLVSKTSLKVGENITVTYQGLLANCGADSVIMHIGYGDGWENKEFIPMELVNGAFKASMVINNSGSLNIAFKDTAENWDNNSGNNFTFKVAKAKAAKSEIETEAKDKKPKTAKAPKKAVAKDTKKKI